MNTSKMAGALNAISVGFGELAEALLENGTGRASDREAMSAALAPPGASGGPTEGMPEFPPNDYEQLPIEATPQNEPALGRCPDHDVAWTVKPGGTSKAGKAYTAFWRCDTRDANGYCSKKPIRAWADSHPLV